jgi:hypothetical protein
LLDSGGLAVGSLNCRIEACLHVMGFSPTKNGPETPEKREALIF